MAEPSENRDPLPPSSRGKEEEEGAASIQHKVSSSSPSKSASQQAGNVDQGLDMRIPAVNASTTRSSASVKTRIAKMPSILYGTAWKTERTTELVFTAIRNGFRGIDTAGQRKHYREDLVGLAVRKAAKELGIAREDLWLQTKFTPMSGQDQTGPIPYDPQEPVASQVLSSFHQSLMNLHPGWGRTEDDYVEPSDEEMESDSETSDSASSSQLGGEREDGTEEEEEQRIKVKSPVAAGKQKALSLDQAETAPSSSSEPYIDSYLLHSPLNSLEATLEAWRVLEGLVDRGLVRRIGLSNVYDPQIFKALFSAARIKPSILQNRWHFSTGHDVSLLSMLSPVLSPNDFPPASDARLAEREEGEEEEARGITYQPFWSLTGNPRLLVSPPVQDIAVRRKLTSAQVVYGFIKQGMGIPGLEAAVLCGTTDETHMREAVEVASRAEGTWEEAELEMVRKEVYGE